MIQEYLFSDNSMHKKVSEYAPQNTEISITEIENSECWIVTYSSSKNDESAAKELSAVNDYVMAQFSPTVLSNESSAYFNKRLYPLINEFERKLRKLLYLKSALNKGEKASENIRDLESKDLGKVFELLFSDEMFVKNAKKKINSEITWLFTKNEILKEFDALQENTLWDKLIGENAVPALRERFTDIREYRNDVMHAHNTDYAKYNSAKNLFQKINMQIDNEIGSIIVCAEKPEQNASSQNYNTALFSALKSMEYLNTVSTYVNQLSELKSVISTEDYLRIADLLKGMPKFQPSYYTFLTELGKYTLSLPPSQEQEEMKTLFSKMSDAMLEYQKLLDLIQGTVQQRILPDKKGNVNYEKGDLPNTKDENQANDDS